MVRISKLTQGITAVAFAFSLAVTTTIPAYAQKARQTVTLNMKGTTVQHFFAELKKQTGLNFIYSTDLAEKLPHITINATNRSLRSVLDEVMQKVNCQYEIEGNIVTITRRIAGERVRNVSGVVTDETGEPLIGVSICIDDSKVCTITDSKGFYTLKVPAEASRLHFSYIGMSNQEVRLQRGVTPLRRDVQMMTDNTLSEVVVTGYQEISKPKMTGSVTTIAASKLDERYTANLMDNLEGRVAGLSTYNGKMTVRGTSSLFAETSPLLVVDGLPIEGSIDDLNPSDIESVTVLKDAAATAIYGARASNGIIVITTKNAHRKGKIDIDFSANLTVYEKKDMNYHDNFYMNAEEQVNAEAKYWDYYYLNNNGEIGDPIGGTTSDILSGTGQISPIRYAYYQLAQGNITQEQLDVTLNKLKQNNFAKEYSDKVLRRQIMQQYNLSLRGRSEKMQNNLTLNYRHDNAGQINSGESIFNINYKGSYDLAKWLTATFSINGVFEKTQEPGNDQNAHYTDPWSVPAYESLSNPIYWIYCGNPYTTNADGISDLGVNIVDEYYNNTQITRRNHLRYHGELLFHIIDGLTLNAKFIYENDRQTVDWHANADSHLVRTMRNAYAQIDGSTGNMTYLVPETGGMLRSTNTNGRYWTGRAQANYDKTFGKHAFNAIAGIEFRDTKTNGTKTLLLGYDEQLQNSLTHTVNFSDLSTMTMSPYFMQGNFPAQAYVFDPYLRDGMGVVVEQHHRYASGYFNLTYTYDEKYNFFGSFRKDYADVYGLNAKFRGRPLWSVGFGWNMQYEPFMEKLKWINVLKPRISYGVTGNIYQAATSYMTASSTESNRYTGLPMGEIESPANPNLKWEQSRTTNIGIDFSLFDNRLRGAFDYYNKEGKDIFSNRSLDPITGFTSMFMNTASMRNRGVELSMSYDWLRAVNRDALGWSTSMTFSHNSNKIISVENPATTASALINNPYREGYPTSALWSYRFAGISSETSEQGSTLWYIENGNTAHQATTYGVDILEYSGQTDPKNIIGIDNTLTWKGFSLGILMAYYGGHKMRVLTQDEYSTMPYTALPSYFLNAWTPDNPTMTPALGQYFKGSTSSEETANANIAIQDADFLKIRNIVIGYSFPQEWCHSIGINHLTLRMQINNPKAIWTKNNQGIDPETLGVRNPSSFVFGLNINL